MALINLRWLYRFVRRHTNYIPEDTAHFWQRRLSLVYLFIAWNACGLVMFQVMKGKSDWAKDYKPEVEQNLTPARQFAKILGVKDATVYRVSGFNVRQYNINEDGQQNEENAQNDSKATVEK